MAHSTCISPIMLKRNDARTDNPYRMNKVPCGKCYACVLRRSKAWTFRLQQELNNASSCAFFTFTYSDENLPWENGVPVLRKEHYTTWFKKFRQTMWREQNPLGSSSTYKKLGKDVIKLKYYAIGEYGDKTQRPHYHSIIYNLPVRLTKPTYWSTYRDLQEEIQESWRMGEVHVSPATTERLAYCAGYVNKKIYGEKIIYDESSGEIIERPKEFSLMSKGLGKVFLTPQMVKYLKSGLKTVVKINGFGQSLPRYYRDQLFTKPEKQIILERLNTFYETKVDLTDDEQCRKIDEQIRFNINKYRKKHLNRGQL